MSSRITKYEPTKLALQSLRDAVHHHLGLIDNHETNTFSALHRPEDYRASANLVANRMKSAHDELMRNPDGFSMDAGGRTRSASDDAAFRHMSRGPKETAAALRRAMGIPEGDADRDAATFMAQ
jgi:hypothetical protein